MNALISVIIPVYKVEAYLEPCIESVLAQTYQNIEIIMVDDGSPDRCPQICDNYAARDARIRVIHKENGGLSSARNAGIDAARGEFLAFLDSDDLWTPVFLERLYQAIRESGADVSVALFRRFKGEPPTDVPVASKILVMTQREAFECLFTVRNENMVVAPNKLYRRSLFTHIRYPLGKLHEDEAIIHEIIGSSKKVAWLDEEHYYYRESPNSITTARFSLKRLDEIYAKEKRIAFFEEHDMQDLADRTKRVYLNNLIRLHRTVQHDIVNEKMRRLVCKALYKKFRDQYRIKLMKHATMVLRIRCALFLVCPMLYSRFEYVRLKRKGLL